MLISIDTGGGDFTRVGRLIVSGIRRVITVEFGGSVGGSCRLGTLALVYARLHEPRIYSHMSVRALEYHPTTHLLSATHNQSGVSKALA